MVALLVVSATILLVRWNTIRQRIPLAPLPQVVSTATAADTTASATGPEDAPAPRAEPALTQVDLNTAGIAELDGLPGIGPVLAGRIVETRDALGGFKAVDDLLGVEGIGPSKLAKLREHVRVGRQQE